jgi:transcriptional regulator with XRE-family HTH domain
MVTTDSKDTQRIARKIRAARAARNLTQHQVARLTRISRTTLADIETARRPPGYFQLMAIHRALKTSPGELLAV